MAEAKTGKTKASVKAFLDAVTDDQRRADALLLKRMMGRITGKRAAMWGDSIVGFGSYRYEYASGRSGDWPLTGFSPRKGAMSIYVMSGFGGQDALLKRLGKFKTGKACLYVKRLEDVDLAVLEQLITRSVAAKAPGR